QFGIDNGSGAVWQNNSLFNNLIAGNYTITVLDSNGCVDSVTALLSQPQSILLQPTSSAANCNGSNDGSVSVIVNGGVAPFTYLWITNDTSQTVSNLAAGNYQVTVTDSNNCSKNATAIVNEPTILLDNAQVTDITCNGLTDGSIVLNVNGGTAPYYYQWSGSLVTSSSISNLIAGTYTVTVTDGHNCNFITTYNIIEPAVINAYLAADSVNCFGGNTGELQVVFVNPGLQPYTYQWNGSVSATSSAANLYAGNYSVTIADNNGCTANLAASIYEPSDLQAAANGTNILCNGMATGTASVNVNGGTLPYSYQWTGGGTTPSINNLTNGTYTVTVTDGNGCEETTSVILSQPAVLSLRVSSDHVICIGQDATLTAAAYGGTPPYAFTWNTGWNTNIYNVHPDTSIVYYVFVTDSNGCTVDSQQIAVNVNPALDVVVSIGDTICKGETTVVTCLASGGNGGPYTYTWSNNPAGTPQITVTPDSTTTYSVSISDGCTVLPANTSTTVEVNELPNTQFSPDPGDGCVPLTVSFINASNGIQYMWNFGDGSHSVMNNPHHTYTMSGTFDVSLEATSTNGCKKIVVIPDAVHVFELPIAEFGYSPEHATILNKNIEFSNHSYSGNSYWWDFGDGIGTSAEMHPEYMYGDSGTYTVMLVAISSNGCEDTTYGEVIIEGIFSLYVPNSFTPNGDGRNDFFTYYGEGIVSADLQIFNRWGDVIYRDDSNTHAGWNGTSDDGKECQQGVYIYLIKAKDANGTDHEVKGTVTLVR
ncbi:MAG: PKD domain-containing protein, partial [Bacteroidota bacterium]